MAIEKIEFPSAKELGEALNAYKKKGAVNPYSYSSTLLRVKKILHVDWTKNTVEVEV